MYSKEEKKQLVEDFWEEFNFYCDSIEELASKKKKWLLHRTGISHVQLKFVPGRKDVKVGIEVNHKSESRRIKVYERIVQCKAILEAGFKEELNWEFFYERESGQQVCFIYTCKDGVDLHRRGEWTEMFEFMAENMILLEENLLSIREFIKD